ncbi:MAG: decaprenyl-phosphate phosphoribosyltransferase [Acidobacteriota bacterium]
MFGALIRSMRPTQWAKNLFVLAPLVFSELLLDGNALPRALAAFGAFCLAASAIYLLNDVKDRERDRHHPLKQHRPIAAGTLPVSVAVGAAAAAAIVALVVAWMLNPVCALVVGIYLVLNGLYTLHLKEVVILDVMIISLGFVLRVLVGGAAIGVAISNWLLLCTIFLALFLAFSKRRHEITLLADRAKDQRLVLGQYSETFLDQMINVVTASAVVSYALWAVSPEATEAFGGTYLLYTVPLVLFGVFRYLYLVYQKPGKRNPTEALMEDLPFLTNLALWGTAVVLIVYVA